MELNNKEKVTFMDEQSVKIQDPEDNSSKKCRWCTKKRCGIISGVIIGVVVIVLLAGYLRFKLEYSGTASVANAEDIMKELEEDVELDTDISGMWVQ